MKYNILHIFKLFDGTILKVKDKDKMYRIGMIMRTYNKKGILIDSGVETFYELTLQDIKRYLRRYDGELVYMVEM